MVPLAVRCWRITPWWVLAGNLLDWWARDHVGVIYKWRQWWVQGSPKTEDTHTLELTPCKRTSNYCYAVSCHTLLTYSTLTLHLEDGTFVSHDLVYWAQSSSFAYWMQSGTVDEPRISTLHIQSSMLLPNLSPSSSPIGLALGGQQTLILDVHRYLGFAHGNTTNIRGMNLYFMLFVWIINLAATY